MITKLFPSFKEKYLFQPKQGHLFSGRNNDVFDLNESIWTLKIFLKVVRNEIIRNLKIILGLTSDKK